MLVVDRKIHEGILVVSSDFEFMVRLLRIGSSTVSIGIEGPQSLRFLRNPVPPDYMSYLETLKHVLGVDARCDPPTGGLNSAVQVPRSVRDAYEINGVFDDALGD